MSVVFSSVFVIERLELMAHLGIYDDERAGLQPIAFDVRLYFPTPPGWTFDDNAQFFDYQQITDRLRDLVKGKPYRLIEFLANEAFNIVRAHLDEIGSGDIKIWLKLTKLEPPIPELKGGSSYITSDLPLDAPRLDVY